MAVGGVLLPSLLAFFQGTAYVTARGLSAESLVRYTAKWLEMISSALPHLARQIDTGDYTVPIGAAVGIFEEAIAEQRRYGQQEHLDVSWQAPLHHVLNRAIAEGHRCTVSRRVCSRRISTVRVTKSAIVVSSLSS